MAKASELLAVPQSFVDTALAFPSKVDQALALISTPKAAKELLAKADTLEHYAKRVRTDNRVLKPIQYGKLKIVARLAELMPREKGGRGKTRGNDPPSFDKDTIATYRKIGDNADRINDYWEAVKDDDDVEMPLIGFIRYVGSDGNTKAHQNKGVIEWYTPDEYIEAARQTMGGIDIDPASSAFAQKIVKAKKFFDIKSDGLAHDWKGNVFLNPPFRADLAKAFISKLCSSHNSGDVPQAILLTNNNTDTLWWHEAAMASKAICFTKGRINFYSPAGEIAQPTNGHTIFHFGKRLGEFKKQFSGFGTIMVRAA